MGTLRDRLARLGRQLNSPRTLGGAPGEPPSRLTVRWIRVSAFGAGARAAMYEDLYAFQRAGMPLYEALTKVIAVMERRAEIKARTFVLWRFFRRGAPLLPMIREWARRIERGDSFSGALEGWVPPEEVSLIHAGEESDNLLVALNEAADLCHQRTELRAVVAQKLSLPAFLILLFSGVLYYIAATVVPSSKDLVPPEAQPYLTKIYFAATGFYLDWSWLMGLLMLVLTIAITISLPRANGAMRDRLDNVFPYTVYRMIQSGFFLITLSAMLRSSMTANEALHHLRHSAPPYIRKHINAALAALERGQGESVALDTGLLPPALSDRLRIYSELPDFAQIMDALGRDSTKIVKKSVARVAGTVNVGVLAFIGAFIVTTIFSLGLLSLALSSNVQSSL